MIGTQRSGCPCSRPGGMSRHPSRRRSGSSAPCWWCSRREGARAATAMAARATAAAGWATAERGSGWAAA
eukprot:scaffold43849_cov64-Phaeocystis_antarctica.AAC.1